MFAEAHCLVTRVVFTIGMGISKVLKIRKYTFTFVCKCTFDDYLCVI